MQLQVALDFVRGTEGAKEVAEQVFQSIDIIEIGTPLIMECGLEAVREVKKAFPYKLVLADLKIADAGFQEAAAAFRDGADIITVLAVTEDSTIENTIKAAKEYGGQVMVDMLAVRNLPERLVEIDKMGADYICLHTSKDLQKLDRDAAKAFEKLRQYVKQAKLAIAGGIGESTASQYAAIRPDVIIVGEGIVNSAVPAVTAKRIKSIIEEYES